MTAVQGFTFGYILGMASMFGALYLAAYLDAKEARKNGTSCRH